MDDLQNKEGVEREPKASPQAPKLEMPKINMPKIQIEGLPTGKITNKLKEYRRVLQITKKPDMEEFKTIVKASAIGVAILGAMGFVVAIIAQLITT
ncbi:MAG: protein translocase SEC61 complex subunit gamma [DPANN group archaeon]|nr:protein translocase SEC61 complex subunit gamma [DPANN group archaeon]